MAKAHAIVERETRNGRSTETIVRPASHQVIFHGNIVHERPCPENRSKDQKISAPDHAKNTFLNFSFPPHPFPTEIKATRHSNRAGLGAGAAGLGDDALKLVNLLLGAAESAELHGLLVLEW